MEVVLLGTGAADGWPNAFCRCASCVAAAREGEHRGQSAALVDDVLLLDCGPEIPAATVRHGRTLAGVRHVLITHAHFDHLGPQALLARSWTDAEGELELIGPADALDSCRDWVGPDDPVRFRPVAAGDRVRVGDYDVRVLPARHRVFRDGDAVLYDVTGPDDSRILWACDTGEWPGDWFDAVRDARYDLVLLEQTLGDREELSEGHLGFARFARMIRELRAAGAVTDRTEIRAVHLGHHNPPPSEMERRLAGHGTTAGRDGQVLRVGGAGADGAARSPGPRTLVLGGARSGKSRYAEQRYAGRADVVYVATGSTDLSDAEWAERVAGHRSRRPESWRTIETGDLAAVLRTADRPLLVDCLGTWLTARLDRHGVWESGQLDAVRADIRELLEAWGSCRAPVVAVTNEVGSGVVPTSASGRLFRDLLGRVNADVAELSDSVVLMVAGQPLEVR